MCSPIRRFKFLVLQFVVWMGLPGLSLVAQDFVLGGIAAREAKNNRAPNLPIKTKWSEKTNDWSIRIGPTAKTRWGVAEAPTFLLQIKNDSKESRKVEIAEEDLHVDINGKVYQWDSPGTKLVTTLAPGEIRNNLFIIRLDRLQWKPLGQESRSGRGKLSALTEGKKAFEVRLNLKNKSNKAQWIKSGKVNIEITKAAFEMPTVSGVLLGQDGKPIKGADIYLCRDAQFSVYYSGYDGTWFKSKSVSHYDPFQSGFVQQAKPIKTNEKGEFLLSPNHRDKRIVVLPPIGSAQVFDIPDSFDDWKVKLQETGSLLIEQDIDGETGTTNSSVYATRPLTNTKGPNSNLYVLSENFTIPLTNKKKYVIKNLVPQTFRLNRYKYVRVGTRSYSIGRRNHQFAIEAGKQTEFRMVRKTGQKISMTATNVPANMQYVVAGVFELSEAVNLSSVYSNQTLWADASAENAKKIKFKSALISPGKYRLVVMSVPKGKKPNQYTYKPDHVGSKIIEVGESGDVNAGDIKLFPSDLWIHNSGMALMVKVVNSKGEKSDQAIWPVSVGYGQGYDSRVIRAASNGVAQAIRAPGKYRFAVGLENSQATLFEIQVPRMTAKKIVIKDQSDWATDSKKKPNLFASVKFDSKSEKIKVDIENRGKIPFTPRFGDIQVLVQALANNFSTGVRMIPPEGSELYGKVLKPGAKISLELDWKELLSSSICTSVRLTNLKFQAHKQKLTKNSILGAVKFGPFNTEPVVFPELPLIPPKPFR